MEYENLLTLQDTSLDQHHGRVQKPEHASSPGVPVESRAQAKSRQYHSLPEEFAAKSSLEKPQLHFTEAPDNSDTPWVWKLTSKPNAIVPLEATPQYEVRRDGAIRLPNPYEAEIRAARYPAYVYDVSHIKPFTNITQPAQWVDTPATLESMLHALEGSREIAIDLEHHDLRSYRGIVCLMQISNRDQDWIVDTLKLRQELQCLNTVFTDPEKVKVLHGSQSDVIWLQRDFGLYLVNMFDTYHASRVLGLEAHGLGYLLKIYCDFEADKRLQMADWRIRPLPEEMLSYAQSDTHFLLYIYDQLRQQLLSRGRDGLDRVREGSVNEALQTYAKVPYEARTAANRRSWGGALNRLYAQHDWSADQFAVFTRLHEWRDKVARRLDDSPLYTMSNRDLVSIAQEMPADVGALRRHHRRLDVSLLPEIIDTVKAALEGPKPAVPPKSTSPWQNGENGEQSGGDGHEFTTRLLVSSFDVFALDSEQARINNVETHESSFWKRVPPRAIPDAESLEKLRQRDELRMQVPLPDLTAEIFRDPVTVQAEQEAERAKNEMQNDDSAAVSVATPDPDADTKAASAAVHAFAPSKADARARQSEIITVRQLGKRSKPAPALEESSAGKSSAAKKRPKEKKSKQSKSDEGNGVADPGEDVDIAGSFFTPDRQPDKKRKGAKANKRFAHSSLIQEHESIYRNARETAPRGTSATGKSMSFTPR